MQKELYKNIFISLYFSLFFASFYFLNSKLRLAIYAMEGVSLFYFCYTSQFFKTIFIKKRKAIVATILLLSFFLSMYNNNNISIVTYCIFFLHFGIVLLLITTKIDEICSYIPFLVNILLLSSYYLRNHSFRDVFPEQSHNYVSVYLLLSIMIIYIAQFQNNLRRNNYLIIILCLLFSILATGRGGILIFLILLFFSVIQNMRHLSKKNYIINLLMLFFIACGGLLLLLKGLSILGKGFSERGLDSNGRFIIWAVYLSNCLTGIKNIIFGVNVLDNIPDVFNHLHNSFLTLYADFGLIGFFFFIILFIQIGLMFWKKNRNLFLIFLILMFRSFTDLLFPNFAADIFVMYFISLLFIEKGYIIYEKEHRYINSYL